MDKQIHCSFIKILFLLFNCVSCLYANNEAVVFKISGNKINVIDKIICRDNSIITIEVDKSKLKNSSIDTNDNIILECVKNASNKDFTFEQGPIVKESTKGSLLIFKIAGFKAGSIYSYRLLTSKRIIITEKDIQKSEETKTIKLSDTVVVKKENIQSVDSTYIVNRITIREFVIEAREMNSLTINIGVYYSPYNVSNYSLYKEVSGLQTIVDNGSKTTQGIMLGATYFLRAHDEKALFDNPNRNFLDQLMQNLGLFVGVGFSSQNKGIDNILIGGNLGLRSANFIIGVNILRKQELNNSYKVGDIYKGTEINSIVSYDTKCNLFVGASVNSSLVISVLSLLISLAGFK